MRVLARQGSHGEKCPSSVFILSPLPFYPTPSAARSTSTTIFSVCECQSLSVFRAKWPFQLDYNWGQICDSPTFSCAFDLDISPVWDFQFQSSNDSNSFCPRPLPNFPCCGKLSLMTPPCSEIQFFLLSGSQWCTSWGHFLTASLISGLNPSWH